MSVFISYRTVDARIALDVFGYLRDRGVPVYVDALDPELVASVNIAITIRQRLGECTHLLAIVTPNTAGSWWVPWEIGVATEKQTRISSYTAAEMAASLPDYLTMWPVLYNHSHLDRFIELYRGDLRVALNSGDQYRARYSWVTTPADFHRSMMDSTGQVYKGF